MVVMIHTSQVFNLTMPLDKITQFGDMGCQIFFTISAFCLCLSNEKRNDSYSTFVLKRLKRIAPAYWLTICLGIFVSFLYVHITGENITGISLHPMDIVANVALLNGVFMDSANNQVVRGGGLLEL